MSAKHWFRPKPITVDHSRCKGTYGMLLHDDGRWTKCCWTCLKGYF